jgi:general secretion pathway protein D
VEVTLAEVLLTDDLSFGIDWFLKTRNNTTGTMNTLGALPATPTGTVGPFSPGLQLINFAAGGDIRAVLQTFGKDGRATVLASPNIMVLDNEKAEIKVGDRISVQTQSQTGVNTGTGVLNSFQYLETGILLAVTPRINSGGLVTLELNQEVSEVDRSSVTASNPNPDVITRNAKTSVIVASGESIALGGLIRDIKNYGSSGIPLLSKIPLIGAAFGVQTYNRRRTELVMVITPKIVNDPAQAREATQELRQKLPALRGLLPPVKTTPFVEVPATVPAVPIYVPAPATMTAPAVVPPPPPPAPAQTLPPPPPTPEIPSK